MKTKRRILSPRTMGRLGGSAGTEAQNEARRLNAQRAGRPRRVCIYCGEAVRSGHVKARLDKTCGAHGWRWQKPSEEDRPAVTPDPTLVSDVLKTFAEELAHHPRLRARLHAAARALA